MADKKISALTAASTPLAGTEVLPIVQGGATVKVAVSDLTAGRNVAMADLTTTGNTILGNAQADTLNVGNGDIIKDGSGNVGFGVSPTQGLDIYKNITKFNNASYVGYIGSGASLAGGAATDFVVRSDNDLTFAAGGPYERAKIVGSTGNFNLNVGNLVIGTSGKGIDFSATPGTGTSELFADYEEGTWTPTVAAAIGSYTTVTGQAGTYTKVGRQVTLKWYFVVANKGTGLGAVNISNLPFASNASTGNYYAGCGYDTSAGVAQTAAMTATTSIDVLKYDGTDPIIITRGQVGQITYFV